MFYEVDIPHTQVAITDTAKYIVNIDILSMHDASLSFKECLDRSTGTSAQPGSPSPAM